MNPDTLREKADVELQDELAALRKEIFDLQFRSGSSETEERGKFVKVRRDVARVLTILRERKLGVRGQTASGK
ncbi:MAG: 50S ribosomal protein L29 [Planctomycetota bacterium]